MSNDQSILDNRFNEIVFKYTLQKSPSLKRYSQDNEPLVLELMDRIYSGRNNPDYINYEYIKKLEEISFLNINMKGCTGSIISTTELAESIINQIQINKDIDPNEDNNMSEYELNNELVKSFSSKKFVDEVTNSNEAQDKVEALFSSAGTSIETQDLSQQEIDVRKNILQALKNRNYRSSLKVIMDCFGYFYVFASALKKEKFTDLAIAPTDVEMGNNIKNALPSELGYLDSEELLPIFAKKLINREFLQFRYQAKQNVGKGNIVLGLDISDSMQYTMGDSPIVGASKLHVALGFSLAIMKLLKEENRQFVLFTFNHYVNKVYDSRELSYYDMVNNILMIHVGGGTRIFEAIKKGLTYSQDNYDFIMVSDCEDDLNKEETEFVLKNKTHRFSTLVLPDAYYKFEYVKLKEVCDSFIKSDGPDGFKHEISNLIK